MKIDPHHKKEAYLKWKEDSLEKGVSEVSKYNSDLILSYLESLLSS